MSEGPMSSRTTVAVLLGSMAAASLAFWMGWGREPKPSPKAELEECQMELNRCQARTYECLPQPTNPPDLEPWETLEDRKRDRALPPIRQPVGLPVVIIPKDLVEPEPGTPPRKLPLEDGKLELNKQLGDYLTDGASDGEVMPGPFADDAEWTR